MLTIITLFPITNKVLICLLQKGALNHKIIFITTFVTIVPLLNFFLAILLTN